MDIDAGGGGGGGGCAIVIVIGGGGIELAAILPPATLALTLASSAMTLPRNMPSAVSLLLMLNAMPLASQWLVGVPLPCLQ